MNFARDDFFPGTGFTGDEHRQVRRPNPSRHRVDLTHPRGDEQVALEHQAFLDRPERCAMTLFSLEPGASPTDASTRLRIEATCATEPGRSDSVDLKLVRHSFLVSQLHAVA